MNKRERKQSDIACINCGRERSARRVGTLAISWRKQKRYCMHQWRARAISKESWNACYSLGAQPWQQEAAETLACLWGWVGDLSLVPLPLLVRSQVPAPGARVPPLLVHAGHPATGAAASVFARIAPQPRGNDASRSGCWPRPQGRGGECLLCRGPFMAVRSTQSQGPLASPAQGPSLSHDERPTKHTALCCVAPHHRPLMWWFILPS